MSHTFYKKPFVLAITLALTTGAQAGDIVQTPTSDGAMIVTDQNGAPESFRVNASGEVFVRSLPATEAKGTQVTCFTEGNTGPTGPGGQLVRCSPNGVSLTNFGETLFLGNLSARGTENGKIDGGPYLYSPYFENLVNNFAPQYLNNTKIVNAIECLVTKRSDINLPYDGQYLMSFEIRDFNGEIKHQVSTTPISLDTPQRLDKLIPTLSTQESDRTIGPNEYLTLHAYRIGSFPSDDPAIDFDANRIDLYCEAKVN